MSVLSSDQIVEAANKRGLGDAVGDPLNELATEFTDEIADLAKKRLRIRHGLPSEEADTPSLPNNSVLRQARTAKELGFTEKNSVSLNLRSEFE